MRFKGDFPDLIVHSNETNHKMGFRDQTRETVTPFDHGHGIPGKGVIKSCVFQVVKTGYSIEVYMKKADRPGNFSN